MAAPKRAKKKGLVTAAAPARGKNRTAFPWLVLLKALCLAAVAFWAFAPALSGDWVDDDNFYLTDNPLRHDPARLWKVWFQPGSFIEYYPITECVQMVQWQLWHTETYGYIFTNIVLHIVNALLLWRLLAKFGLRFAWLGGLIFAVHPLMVESVAWISELKNTLSLPPFLLAMGAWIDYEEHKKPRDYGLALGLFLVAMLCKITMSPFAVVVLLYAWWKRGRIDWGDVKVSLPFFAISLALGATTYLAGEWFAARYPHPQATIPIGGPLSRLALVGLSYSFYFSKFFWPWTPSPMYLQWSVDPPSLWQLLPWPVFVGVIYICWNQRQTWGRHVLLGLGFFALFLAPFVGFINVSYMMFTWVMDHFLYIPMIGLIGLVVAGLEHASGQLPVAVRPWSCGAVGTLVLLLAWETHTYAGIYASQESLCAYAIQLNPEARLARVNLGRAMLKKGRYSEAIAQFQEAIKRDPKYVRAYYYMGTALMETGRWPEAAQTFETAIQLDPRDADAYDDLGATLMQMGRPEEAMKYYRQAIQISNFAQPHNDLANALLQAGQLDEAISEYEKAVAISPDVALVRDNLGLALVKAGRVPEATEQFQKALEIDPHDDAAQKALEQLPGLPKSGL